MHVYTSTCIKSKMLQLLKCSYDDTEQHVKVHRRTINIMLCLSNRISTIMIILLLSSRVTVETAQQQQSSKGTTKSAFVKQPHIIFILADDLGFNDVGFHGSAQIPTPNIDALAFSGLILNRYYVNPICTPSRSALMTGKYPIHTGMQHTVLFAAEPRGLPLTEKLLPQYLNDLGYSSHIAGKWHLGHYKSEYTPLHRGFSTHVGYWTGHHDYFDHTAVENAVWGLDMRRGMEVAYDLHGKYTTDIIADEAVRVIAAHNRTQPLFLYVSHAAVHSGNPYSPLPVPDDTMAKIGHIPHYGRRKYAAMLSKLDDSVGRIVQQLQKSNMLNDSLIVFSTDNGGPAEGFNLNFASNWPLRGVKNTLWEGGVRGAALLWSPRIERSRRVAEQVMHITDWVPTLLAAASVPTIAESQQPHNPEFNSDNDLTTAFRQSNGTAGYADGSNLWSALSNDLPSPRSMLVHNIDDIWGSAAITLDDWKLVVGTNYRGAWDGWYGPAGIRDAKQYKMQSIYQSLAGRAISSLGMMPSVAEIIRMRNNATVDCMSNAAYLLPDSNVCNPLLSPCLFDVRNDPCERNNLAAKFPSTMTKLMEVLQRVNATAVPPSNKPLDPRGDPRLWNNLWTNFGDYPAKSKEL